MSNVLLGRAVDPCHESFQNLPNKSVSPIQFFKLMSSLIQVRRDFDSHCQVDN